MERIMSTLTIRNVSDNTHYLLKARAKSNGRSTEAEVRAILDAVAAPQKKLGDAIKAIGQSVRGFELQIERDKTPIDAAIFE